MLAEELAEIVAGFRANGADDAETEAKRAEHALPRSVRDPLAAVRRNMTRRASVQGAGRSDTWEYPELALREAITNALAHRDYAAPPRGAQVQIEMYPDRVEIRNPGRLFGPVTEDGLGEDPMSSSRNASLLKLLEDVPIPGTDHVVREQGHRDPHDAGGTA